MSNLNSGLEAAKRVTLMLPADILVTIAKLSQQSGQPQSQVLLDALRRGLNIDLPVVAEQLTDIAPQPLRDRLAALEAMPQRLEALEGKSIAS